MTARTPPGTAPRTPHGVEPVAGAPNGRGRHPLVAVVPAAAPHRAKRRLAGIVAADDRERLARELFAHTLSVALAVGPVAVVSHSPELLDRANSAGAVTLTETSNTLNEAIAQGLAWAAEVADAAIVLPTDLPRVTAADIEALVAAAGTASRALAVARCQRDDGTNGLYVRPPDLVAPAYGPGSAQAHVDAAEAIGATATSVFLPGFVDLDVPEDWVRWGPSDLG